VEEAEKVIQTLQHFKVQMELALVAVVAGL
jgi:hypothetical protein